MVLSNAERQARYRKNLRKRANDAGASARAAADAALAALWAFLVRAEAGGQPWADKADCETLEQFRALHSGKGFVALLRGWSDVQEEGMTDDEFAAICAIGEIEDALNLKHHAD